MRRRTIKEKFMYKFRKYIFSLTLTAATMLMASAMSAAGVTQVERQEQFDTLIKDSNKTIVVDFWAPWCGPCMRMKPIFEQLAAELADQYLFISVNIDKADALANRYKVDSIPTFVIIKNNSVADRVTGMVSKETLAQKIKR
jgi:thioredoxin 1